MQTYINCIKNNSIACIKININMATIIKKKYKFTTTLCQFVLKLYLFKDCPLFRVHTKSNCLISQPKRMLWVLKNTKNLNDTVLLSTKTYVKPDG